MMYRPVGPVRWLSRSRTARLLDQLHSRVANSQNPTFTKDDKSIPLTINKQPILSAAQLKVLTGLTNGLGVSCKTHAFIHKILSDKQLSRQYSSRHIPFCGELARFPVYGTDNCPYLARNAAFTSIILVANRQQGPSMSGSKLTPIVVSVVISIFLTTNDDYGSIPEAVVFVPTVKGRISII